MDEIEIRIKTLQSRLQILREMNITDPFDLEMDILHNMPEFYDDFPSIVKRLCREENQDNSYLDKMIELLKDVEKNKKSLASVEMNLGEELAEKFIYPVINKKK